MAVNLQTPRPAQELAEEFAIKGGLKLTLDEVLSAVRIIPDRLRNFAVGFGIVAAGGAGFRTEIALINTLTPTVGSDDGTVHVHAVWLRSIVATGIRLAWPTAPLSGFANLVNVAFLDGRNNAAPRSALQEDAADAATGALEFMNFTIAPASDSHLVRLEPPLKLAPLTTNAFRNALVIRPSSDNTDLEATVLWSEPPNPV